MKGRKESESGHAGREAWRTIYRGEYSARKGAADMQEVLRTMVAAHTHTMLRHPHSQVKKTTRAGGRGTGQDRDQK